MWDIILECIRALIIALILIIIWRIGRQRDLNRQPGWKSIIYGWSLILMGSIFDITDNFDSLNQYIIIGDTKTEAFIEKFVGFLLGYVLLFIGFLYWLPAGAKKIDSLKREFVSTASHELKTPLTSIYGALQLIMSGVLGKIPEKVKDNIAVAIRNTERLSLLVNDLLNMEKLENNKMDLKWKIRTSYPWLRRLSTPILSMPGNLGLNSF